MRLQPQRCPLCSTELSKHLIEWHLAGRKYTLSRPSYKIITSIAVLSIFLVSGFFASPRAYAFANGQAASIVIGHSDFVTKGGGGAPANQTNLLSPGNIVFDSAGNLWVADTAQSRVLEFKTPLTTDEAASTVLGKPNLTTSSDSCSSSTFVNPACLNNPVGLAFDPSGNLWVSDSTNSRVLEFTAPFTSGENASVVLGRDNFTMGSSNDATPSATTLNSGIGGLGGLTFDSSGNLWVTDSGWNRVLEFKPPFSNGEAANTVIGQQNFTSSGGPNYPACQLGEACPTASSLQEPIDVKFDSSGNMWIADSTPFRILEYKAPFSNGMSASLVLGEPDFNTYRGGTIIGCTVTPSASCVFPEAISFDESGALWVADAGFSRVLRFDAPFTNNENASLVLGQPNFTSSPGFGILNATATDMGIPGGIAVDSSGNVWVSDQDNNRVLEFSASVAGSSTTSSTSSSSATSLASTTSSSSPTPSSTAAPPPTTSAQQATTQSVTPIVTSASHSSSSSSGTSISLNYLGVVAVVGVVMTGAFVVVRRRGPPTQK
jgi:sugar lactone lactonase YvrE